MKHAIRYPLLVLIAWLANKAIAAPVTLSWDDQPANGFKVYLNGSHVTTAFLPRVTIDLPDGPQSITVTAYNSAGEALPSGMTVTRQYSTDLATWQETPPVADGKLFTRICYITP